MLVYVIVGKGYTEQKVINELKDEGYTHSFFFPYKLKAKDRMKQINIANEIWCFGDCETYDDYIYAKSKGKDIWIMG